MAFGDQRTARTAPVWREVLLRTQFRKYAVLGVGAFVGCIVAGGSAGAVEAVAGAAITILLSLLPVPGVDVRDLAEYPAHTPVWYEIALACGIGVAAFAVTRLVNQVPADGLELGSVVVGAGAGFLIGIPLGIARDMHRRADRRAR